jgi:hypothetical protein
MLKVPILRMREAVLASLATSSRQVVSVNLGTTLPVAFPLQNNSLKPATEKLAPLLRTGGLVSILSLGACSH